MQRLCTSQDIMLWDHINWGRALPLWRASLGLPPLECLEVGAGRGGISLWLASLGHNVLCTDWAGTTRAEAYHMGFAFSGTISYDVVDIEHPALTRLFDVIAFKSVLGAVGARGGFDAQRSMIHRIHDMLKPGGLLLFAENLKGSMVHNMARKRFQPWGHVWRYPSVNELLVALEPFSKVECRTVGMLGAFGVSSQQRILLAWLDRLTDWVWPWWCRYVAFGVAWKRRAS